MTAAQPPADLTVRAPAGTVLVSVVYRRSNRSLQQTDLAPLVANRQLEDAVGGLVVANQMPSSSVVDYLATAAHEGVAIEVATWGGPEDDQNLGQALARLLSRVNPSGH